jgi:hypothetical protein
MYTLRHDVANVQCLMPGLILAIRKVVRFKVTWNYSCMGSLLCHRVASLHSLWSGLLLTRILFIFAELDLWAREVLVVNNKQPMQNIDRQQARQISSDVATTKTTEIWKIKAAQKTSGVLCAPGCAEDVWHFVCTTTC